MAAVVPLLAGDAGDECGASRRLPPPPLSSEWCCSGEGPRSDARGSCVSQKEKHVSSPSDGGASHGGTFWPHETPGASSAPFVSR